MKKKPRRAITLTEHNLILDSLTDPEWRLYLWLLWFTGASQTDGANLTSQNIDWPNRVLSYRRRKLEGRKLQLPAASLGIGKGLEEVLKQLPSEEALFPEISKMDDRSRACFFWKLSKRLKIEDGFRSTVTDILGRRGRKLQESPRGGHKRLWGIIPRRCMRLMLEVPKWFVRRLTRRITTSSWRCCARKA
jgi:integrase